MKRLVPLFISVTAGFGPLDEMASFRYDHFVHQLADFTADQDQILKSFEIVKTIAAKQPATVPQGAVSPKVAMSWPAFPLMVSTPGPPSA